MTERSYTCLPFEYLEEMEELSNEEYGRLIRALQRYSIFGKAGQCDGTERLFLKRVINRENRYREQFEQLMEQRSQAGKKGARSRWQTSTSPDSMANDGKNGNANTDTDAHTESETDSYAEAKTEDIPAASTDVGGVSPTGVGDPGWKRVKKAVKTRLNLRLTEQAAQKLKGLYHRLGEEVCYFAIDRALEENKPEWAYFRGILRNLDAAGVKTAEEARAYGKPSRQTQYQNPRNDCYQRHGNTVVTELEREAIARALREEFS